MIDRAFIAIHGTLFLILKADICNAHISIRHQRIILTFYFRYL